MTVETPATPEEPTWPKYPDVHVQLSGEDGNVFAIIGRVMLALKRAGVEPTERDAFLEEVTHTESYDHALQTVMRWVDVS